MKEVYDNVKKELQEMPEKLTLQNYSPKLRVIKPYYNGLSKEPEDIRMDSPAGVVFYNLQICYSNQKNISEGVIEDIIWGFRQSGIPADITWEGLKDLKKKGYIFFHDGTGVAIIGQLTEKLWYRWTSKFFDLLRDQFAPTVNLGIDDKIKPKDNKWENIK